ncbi:serine/threonine-protein kinase PLK4-like [Centruroides sculpturatus]|uniref:serine/threonine-protein kinase PLK4-like n=2 Tax=Centruroides sculpturatus TaxID=218467 RepID=UPI000C6EFB13|nr:serine/threonine-protein kinase PLK4-like [Centruroides sculpturatus]
MDSLRMKVLTKADFIQWQKIGEGASASVYRAVYTGNNMEVAIKMIDVHKMRGEMDRISQEIKIHRCLNHPSIVKLYNDFEDAEFKYLVLEYCHKGDLQKYLEARKKPLSEKEACSIFHQLVDGTIYLHSQNVIHRDFKPSNLLLTRNLDIKIADFGMSAIFQSNDVHMTLCGTPNFISPEMLTKRRHGFKTDCWSLGCLLYTLLVGKPPFDTRNVKSTFARVMKTDYKIPEFLSIDAKNLIEALLQEEPEKRIDLQEVLKHSFMKKNGFDYNKRTNKLRIQDSIDSGMGTSSTLSTKISGYSKLQSTNLIRVPSLDTLNSCDFSSDDHVGRRDYGNRHPPSPPVRLKSSPHEVSSNYSNAICQLKNRFSPLPSINDIYKSHGNEELKEIQYGQPSSNEANRFEERCTENLVDEHFLDGPAREMFNGELDAKLCNG